jgi:hypothetical protein
MKEDLARKVDDFDNILLATIDETLRYSLGKRNAEIVFDYIEKKSCQFSEIPRKLDIFSGALRDLLGGGRGQILGAAPILERVIAEMFCRRLGAEFDRAEDIVLVDYIERMRKVHRGREVTMVGR